MTDENRDKYYFSKMWGKPFLIFSAILIIACVVAVIIFGDNTPAGEHMDFQKVLEADSLQEIEDIRDEEVER